MSALRRIRVDRDLSIVELAAGSGVSPEQIRNIESGRARNPRTKTLTKLATALHVQASEIDPMLVGDPNVTSSAPPPVASLAGARDDDVPPRRAA